MFLILFLTKTNFTFLQISQAWCLKIKLITTTTTVCEKCVEKSEKKRPTNIDEQYTPKKDWQLADKRPAGTNDKRTKD